MMRLRESDCANCDHPQHADGVCTVALTDDIFSLCGCEEYEERGVTDYVDDAADRERKL